ncbi:MAG: VOC family protein [Dehalococcoidia bacterium]
MTKTPRITFSHIGLHCFDLEKMVDFYTRVMGLTETDRGEIPFGGIDIEIVFLSGEPRDHHQLALVGKPARQAEKGAVLLNQISFRLDSLATLRAVKDAAQKEGISEFTPITHGNAWSVYFPDPEGNTIEAFVDSPYYVRQPLADPLDLSLSDDEIVRQTKDRYGDDPTFKTMEEWKKEVAVKMGVN